jgi:hypothetical protein
MKHSLLLVIALLSSALPSNARLGETLEQCVARYGNPVTPMDVADSSGGKKGQAIFEKNGYSIAIAFLGGISESEMFSKDDKSAFTDTEKDTILNANAENLRWSLSTEPSVNDNWIREDDARAIYDRFGRTLLLATKKFILKERAEARADQQNKLKDF